MNRAVTFLPGPTPNTVRSANGEVRVTVHPGDVQVVYLVTQ